MVVYTCRENGFWYDEKTEQELDPKNLFQIVKNLTVEKSLDAVKSKEEILKNGLYKSENFQNVNGIRNELWHKENIQIYWRPEVKEVDGKTEMRFKPLPNLRLQELLVIVQKQLGWEETIFDQFYAKTAHNNDCEYGSPYLNSKFYDQI